MEDLSPNTTRKQKEQNIPIAQHSDFQPFFVCGPLKKMNGSVELVNCKCGYSFIFV